ncbi:hypothetical protein ACWGQ5_18455 [Streptomyces sp. NPDC055722]
MTPTTRPTPASDTPDSTPPLRGGTRIPVLGLGALRAPVDETTQAAVVAALRTGHRHVGTAAIYGNEADLGTTPHQLSPASEPNRSVRKVHLS